ncbi:MAG TPA: hypothetical protein VLR88_04420, partial [Propionibacteriaceae bacterium]|nr:hypothetical protein [Propionibacteriaceae bacterium]
DQTKTAEDAGGGTVTDGGTVTGPGGTTDDGIRPEGGFKPGGRHGDDLWGAPPQDGQVPPGDDRGFDDHDDDPDDPDDDSDDDSAPSGGGTIVGSTAGTDS